MRNLNSHGQIESGVPNTERVPVIEKADIVFIEVVTIILQVKANNLKRNRKMGCLNKEIKL